jgi:ribonuclease P protein component
VGDRQKRARVEGLGRGARLRSAAAIQEVFRRGRRIGRPSFILLWLAGPVKLKGVAFAVSRQAGGAVARNRARRRLREAYRRQVERAPVDVAVVFVARPRAVRSDFKEIVGDMEVALGAMARASAVGRPIEAPVSR